jgi:hypothetical protein
MAQRADQNSAITIARKRLGMCVAAVALCTFGCSRTQPYDIVRVSGTVKYEDGSLIPAERIMLKFEPEAAPMDAKTHPRMGFALVNVADGSFDSATTHKPADGLVKGKHKVLVVVYTKDGKTAAVIPKEYEHPTTTPVEIDTANQPIEIKVQKPKSSRV